MADVAERLEGLHDIRLPVEAPEALLADAAGAMALGLALALIVVLLARLVLYRPASRRQRLLAALAESRRLPPGERLLAQAKLLERLASELGGTGQARTAGEGPERTARSDWLAQLDRRLGTDFFSAGAGAGLREALYRRDAPIDPEVIDREVVRLLAKARL